MKIQKIDGEKHIFRRKARKQHTCEKCGKQIEPQEHYIQVSGIIDYKIITFRFHLDCFYPENWVETTDWEIENAEHGELIHD